MKKKKNSKIFIVILVLFGFVLITNFKSSDKEKEMDSLPGFELNAKSDFDKEEFLNMGYPTMFDLGGADCIPCKAMAPELRALNEELMGKAIIKFVDYWKYPHLAKQFNFSVIPTQFFYNSEGILIKIHEGGITKEGMLSIFKEMGYEFNE